MTIRPLRTQELDDITCVNSKTIYSTTVIEKSQAKDFENWIQERDKQIRAKVIEEINKYVNCNIHFYNSIEQKSFCEFLEKLKEQNLVN